MTLKELSEYSKLLKRTVRGERLLESLCDAVESSTQTLTSLPRKHGVSDKVGDLTIEIIDLTERLRHLRGELLKEEKKLSAYLDSIDDDVIYTIFRLHFYRGFTWGGTAEIMGYDYDEEKVRKLAYRYIDGK